MMLGHRKNTIKYGLNYTSNELIKLFYFLAYKLLRLMVSILKGLLLLGLLRIL